MLVFGGGGLYCTAEDWALNHPVNDTSKPNMKSPHPPCLVFMASVDGC